MILINNNNTNNDTTNNNSNDNTINNNDNDDNKDKHKHDSPGSARVSRTPYRHPFEQGKTTLHELYTIIHKHVSHLILEVVPSSRVTFEVQPEGTMNMPGRNTGSKSQCIPPELH